MQYNEEVYRIAEEGRTTANPITMPYISCRRKEKPAPKKKLYSERSLNLMGGLVGAGLFVVSILGLVAMMGQH